MKALRWTPEAAADLFGINDFIARDSEQAAVEVTNRIYDAVSTLEQFPHMGRPGRVPGTRELVVTSLPYIAVYEIRDDAIVVLLPCGRFRDEKRSHGTDRKRADAKKFGVNSALTFAR